MLGVFLWRRRKRRRIVDFEPFDMHMATVRDERMLRSLPAQAAPGDSPRVQPGVASLGHGGIPVTTAAVAAQDTQSESGTGTAMSTSNSGTYVSYVPTSSKLESESQWGLSPGGGGGGGRGLYPLRLGTLNSPTSETTTTTTKQLEDHHSQNNSNPFSTPTGDETGGDQPRTLAQDYPTATGIGAVIRVSQLQTPLSPSHFDVSQSLLAEPSTVELPSNIDTDNIADSDLDAHPAGSARQLGGGLLSLQTILETEDFNSHTNNNNLSGQFNNPHAQARAELFRQVRSAMESFLTQVEGRRRESVGAGVGGEAPPAYDTLR
jgi:hypothetical protein